jgi:hypothetical protein
VCVCVCVCVVFVVCVLTSEGAVASFETESTCSVRPSAENRMPLEHFVEEEERMRGEEGE